MKVIKKLIFLTISLLFFHLSMVASTNHFLVSTDTIPTQIQKKYTGNRIIVKSIKVTKKRGKTVKIEYNLSNSGRNKVKLGKGKNVPDDLIIEFDKSLEENGLTASKESLIENLKKQSISIRAGQLIMGKKLKFDFTDIPPTDRIVEEEIKNENVEIKETITEKVDMVDSMDIVDEPMPRKRKSQPVPEFVFPEFENSGLAETILTKPEEEESKDSESKNLPSIQGEEKAIEKTEIEKVTREKVSIPDPIPNLMVQLPIPIPIFNFQFLSPEELQEIINSREIEKEEDETIQAIENQEEIILNENAETEIAQVEELEKETIPNINTDSSTISNERKCADLVLENIEIVKKNRRAVTIQYTLKNVGNAPISLVGESKKDHDNLAITAHFTRSEKLTRGSIPIKLFYLKKGLKSINGILLPNQSITQKIKIETYKMTRFTPVVALSIDPLQTAKECTKINNVSFINIAENDAPSPLEELPIKPSIKKTGEEMIGANGMKKE